MAIIKLYGVLGKKYGKIHNYMVKSIPEAVNALEANIPGIRAAIGKLDFHVLVDNRSVKEHEVRMLTGDAEIKLIPVLQGARKSPWITIIIGIVLIIAVVATAGVLAAPAAGAAGAGTGAAAGAGAAAGVGIGATIAGSTVLSIGLSIGVSLVLGGIAGVLAGTPKTEGLATPVDKNPSVSFDGPQNTVVQGVPVPLGYGELIVGSATVSNSISLEDMSRTVTLP